MLGDYDTRQIRQLITLFPSLPIAIVWKGYFALIGVPLWDDDDEEEEEQKLFSINDEDPFDAILVSWLISLDVDHRLTSFH